MRFAPEVELQTLFEMNADRRIISTREPNPRRGPPFALIRDDTQCAWAVELQVEDALAAKLNTLASEEHPISDLRETPRHADAYACMLGGEIRSGPAFQFPDNVGSPPSVVEVHNLEPLLRHFAGWTEDELPERSPIMAVFEAGAAVSVCFCARRSVFAAEAGVETASAYRGRGFAGRVAAAWATSIRRTGLLPIYSTSWENAASLAVARKLGLVACAQIWSVVACEPMKLRV
jgi:hypothetical protein